MRRIIWTFWVFVLGLSLLWFLAEPQALSEGRFFPLRNLMIQYSGVLAIGVMSLGMILALRPRLPEPWFGGLDKMYRLHKWLGIAGLVLAVVHWLWSEAPKWAVSLGWLARPARGPRPAVEHAVHQFLQGQRHLAEGVGEWAFYAAVVLIVLALLRWFPYHLFYKTHRLLAVAYLVLAFHAVVLTKFGYWATPLGVVLALLLAGGVVAAVLVLLRRVGAGCRVRGRIVALRRYPGVRALETEIAMAPGWPGHRPGQFAFAMSDVDEGAHPYTIASAWHPADGRITFVTKALGDHTSRLPDKLRVGQEVVIEGPYGCFTFEDDVAHQVWIGGGIGITPFIARMKQLARERASGESARGPVIDLFHTTAEVDEGALSRLRADAAAAGVRLHILVDAKDGFLTGERVFAAVPDWREASFWFCGPAGFGAALRRDLAAHGVPVVQRFHHEVFAMR